MAFSAWGIDLGNRALKAVKLVREGDRLRVDDFEVIEHSQTLSVAGDNKESILQTALANFVQRHNTRGIPVAVSVSGQQSFARFIKLPPVEPKKIPEIVKFEAIQQIPFPLDDVEWSYQLFQEKDSPDVEVGIFAMKKELVNKQIGYLTDLGLDVQVVQMQPLAVYNAMYHDGQTSQTTMFMDSGADNTDLIIADGQTVWLRTLPIGGNAFTEALAKNFKLSFAKAEELKRNAATSKYAKQIFQAMRPVFADLVAEVQRSIGFYASVHRDARIQRIVAQGSTFQLPGLQKYLQTNLQLPVEKLDGFAVLPPTDGKMAANFSENSISLAGAYGLAVQAIGDAQITSSLLPEAIRRVKMWKEKSKWFGLTAAVFLVGTVGVGVRYYIDAQAYQRKGNDRDTVARFIDNAQKLQSEWKEKIENKTEDDRQKLLSVFSLLDYRNLWNNILADIERTVPANDLEQLTAVPRGERQQILINSIRSQYWPNLKDPLAATTSNDLARFIGSDVTPTMTPTGGGGEGSMGEESPWGMPWGAGPWGGGGGGAPWGPGGMGQPWSPTDPSMSTTTDMVQEAGSQRGYLVTIRGTTPNSNGASYVDEALVKKLLANTAEKMLGENKNYYFARVELVKVGLRNVPSAGQTSTDDMAVYGNMNFAQVDPKRDPSKDRFFPNESIANDTEFTVLAVVVLDPKAEEKKE